MNRIIIIGNGFDLAHGLKTSYGDFLEWVKSQAIKNSDEYFEHILIPQVDVCFSTNKPKASSFFKRYYNGSKKLDEFISEFRDCKFIYRNKFLEHLINAHSLKNWVDIEEEYFKELNKCFQTYVKSTNTAPITKLNEGFSQIKDYLEEYLCGENKEIKVGNLRDSIIKPFDKEDNVPLPTELDKILFLNFNYTSSEKYYEMPSTQTIHIHGELKNKENPIIFGYGNENTKEYKEIKEKNHKEFFTNMKQFKYLNVSNYNELMLFVKSAQYQIYIWGHSCGNSDGTLLKELFEDKNCISIKPFYHKKNGSNNYNDIVMNISSHFSNDTDFRKKIVSERHCKELK